MTMKLLLAVLLSVPFTIINFNAYLKGNAPSAVHVLSTGLFLLVWLAWAFYSGQQDRKPSLFIRFSSVYGLISIIGVFLMYFVEAWIIAVPVGIIILGPVYGLRHFMPTLPYEAFGYACVLIVYAASLIGAFIGELSSKRSAKA
ncbi:hypothetical protein CHH67_15695 [Paenibacillus campinasensis]|uniref:Uncharacterized protein n=2 Tax=Paenibacillus campinasensis TaxID=66347 RepID=A0A268EQD6_9BACL|nr:hypothetical protein CHH67_15695 [Paenibacillus campinasensis]